VRFGTSDGVVLLAGANDVRIDAVAYALERRLFDCNASAIVLARAAEGGVSNARVLAESGLLAIVIVERSAVAAARAELEGQRVLVAWLKDGVEVQGGSGPGDIILDPDAESADGSAETLLGALRQRGWVGQ
jgi:hypothetical protein